MALSLNEMALILIALLVGLVVGMMISGRGKYKRLWREEQKARQQAVENRDVLGEKHSPSILRYRSNIVESHPAPPRH